MTASIARVYISNFMLAAKKPVRLAYIGPCYRYDNPQYGRYREFRQAGFEIIGTEHPEADAEILTLCHDLMKRLGFKEFNLKVGHVGILRNILEQEGLGEEIQNRIFSLIDRERIDEAFELLGKHKLGDSSIKTIEELMQLKGKDTDIIIDKAYSLLESFREARKAVLNLKDILALYSSGLDARLVLDLGFARGLEYYTGMIFEIFIPGISIAVGGGGRYDNLIETFNGQSTPAVGCAPGIDRLVLAMDELHVFDRGEKYSDKIMILCMDEKLLTESLKITQKLRENNFPTEFEVGRKKLKKGIAYASSKKIRYTIFIGSNEISSEELTVKDLAAEEQTKVPIKSLIEFFTAKIKK
jgi:histidyl-tRNA synthetase